jgi:predicted AAA+ superfamily ATPase
MAELLARGIQANRIAYLTCELYLDGEELRAQLTTLLEEMPATGMRFLLLDEVTYVTDWDRVVKFMADAGSLHDCFVLLTGSDHVLIQDSLKRLPGRRGVADQHDFHLHPLSFHAFCQLRGQLDAELLNELATAGLDAPLPQLPESFLSDLEDELRQFHVTGGFLTAINDFAAQGEVRPSTLRIYSEWIRGDVLRANRSERFLRELLGSIDTRYGSQVTWNSLSRELSIQSPNTIADYAGLLERMDAVRILPALDEQRRSAAPKKARKLYFADPFIHRAVRSLLQRSGPELGSEEHLQQELEAVFAAHVHRRTDAYYIKGAGEIDIAFYDHDSLQLIEVKWSRQLRPELMKEIRRRDQGIVAARVRSEGRLGSIRVLPAAVVLLRSCPVPSE